MVKNNKDKEDNLILGQKKLEQFEAMKFDDPGSKPDPSTEAGLASRETPFKSVDFPETPTPDEGYTTYEELLASEEYKHALDVLARYTGERNIGTGVGGKYGRLSSQAMRILGEIQRAENLHERELESLAERVIRDYFKIPENALQLDLKLLKASPQPKKSKSKEEEEEREEELMNDINELTPERAKRRLINSMTQGHAVDAMYLFEKVGPELQRILGVRNITLKYGVFISTMMLGYWQWGVSSLDSQIGGADDEESESGASGKSNIDTSTNPPTMHAQAIIFPFLLHEAIKGIMEYFGKEKNPEDPEKTQAAVEIEDQPEHEAWDIKLGPAIWRRLVKLFPASIVDNEDKKAFQFYIYVNIINLPTKEFVVLMKEVIGNTPNGKQLMDTMYYDLSRKLDGEEVTNEDSEFRRLIDELTADISDDDLGNFLDELGISLT